MRARKLLLLVGMFVFALSALAQAQRPSQGNVLLHVTAGEGGVYKGLQQRTPDLEESARDVRRHLGKGKWTKVTDDIDEADIRIVILGRRRDPDKGIALGYTLDAGAYKTEDELFDASITQDVRSGAARHDRSTTDSTAQKTTAKYEDLALQFARSLDTFCEQNYERILAQR
jgi:hypothetical protein